MVRVQLREAKLILHMVLPPRSRQARVMAMFLILGQGTFLLQAVAILLQLRKISHLPQPFLRITLMMIMIPYQIIWNL